MFTTIDEAITYVTSRRNQKKGFENFAQVMEECGNPQDSFKSIHVAGTNGKGSTVTFLASMLQAAGYTVGSFTSPHLVSHLDRIKINGVWIPEDEYIRLLNENQERIERYHLDMFEIVTLFMSLYFQEQHVDFAVVEVGLGGRLDATNTLHHPEATVICTIGLDHTELLGDTLEKIAQEKAGIIKPGVPCVVGRLTDSCKAVIQKIAQEKNAPYRECFPYDDTPEGILIQGESYTLGLKANYQKDNAALAVTVISLLNKEGTIAVDSQAMAQGLRQSRWPGRFEEVAEDPLIILDGAHNQEGILALTNSLAVLPRPIITVFAALKDKPTEAMVERLRQKSDVLLITSFDFYRAKKVEEYQSLEGTTPISDWAEAIEKGKELATKDGTLLICGSLYFISEVRKMFVKAPNM